MNAARAFQEIARACLGQFRLNVPLVLDHRDAAALHQSRVAVRRLRSALSMHKPLFRDGRAVALKDELRWLAGEMGKARDLDVLIGRAGDGALADRLLKVRGDAYANAVAALESARARALMIDTVEWIETGDWLSDPKRRDRRELPAGLFAARGLDRLRRRVKKDGRHLAKLGDEARHELRKDAKKLRYAAEFFAALNDRKRERRRHKRFVSTLAALQDKLGALNDLATAPELLRRLDLADDPRAIALLGADRTEDLIDAAAQAHDALVDAKPFWR
jgi:CHAD domain-containing protein